MAIYIYGASYIQYIYIYIYIYIYACIRDCIAVGYINLHDSSILCLPKLYVHLCHNW